jgi:hypothetical protein
MTIESKGVAELYFLLNVCVFNDLRFLIFENCVDLGRSAKIIFEFGSPLPLQPEN